MENTRPLIIVLTPVRNEAWILKAFLEATSLWADSIIIADQMSTDGSREIAQSFSKVILIDNNRQEMHQAATRQLLFNETKKIEGDKILFALDADEFLSGRFTDTPDWKRIMDSKPGDCFFWRWMNLKRDDVTQYSTFEHYYWAVHVSDDLWEGVFPDNFIHEWRLPWPNSANKVLLNDFYSIHFARVNNLRQSNKERFYQVSTLGQDPHKSVIGLYRHYHQEQKLDYYSVPKDAYGFYEDRGVDILSEIDMRDEGDYYTNQTLFYFGRDGVKKYSFLDIWDSVWMKKNGIKNPQTFRQRVLMRYLSITQPISSSLIIRVFDKFLKRFI